LYLLLLLLIVARWHLVAHKGPHLLAFFPLVNKDLYIISILEFQILNLDFRILSFKLSMSAFWRCMHQYFFSVNVIMSTVRVYTYIIMRI
jgi:hypothetical protein